MTIKCSTYGKIRTVVATRGGYTLDGHWKEGPNMSARILIVEDDENSAYLLDYTIRKKKLTSFVAKTGRSALEILEAQPIDLILMDFELPDIYACELVKLIRQNSKTAAIPIALVTALAEAPKDCRPVLEAHVRAYLNKPIDPMSIEPLIRQLTAKGGPGGPP